MESEECVERIACEVGGLARDAGLDNNIATVAAKFAPSKYSKFAKQVWTIPSSHLYLPFIFLFLIIFTLIL